MMLLLLLISSIYVSSSFGKVKVVVSEVVAHSDVEDGYYDYIELHNEDNEPVDLTNYFLSDSGRNKTRCQLKPGTILGPDEYRSFSCQNPADHLILANPDCPFRLSKVNDHIYFGRTHNNRSDGNYTLVSEMNIGSTINRISNSLWPTEDKDDRHMWSFPTENFANRYPIVGPVTFTEVVWDVPPGKLQWIKLTCLYGQYPTSFTSPCRMTNRQGRPFSLRLEAQKDLITDADVATPSALEVPIDPLYVPVGKSYYLTNGSPAAFRAMYANDPRISDLTFVHGPWAGDLQDPTTKDVFLGLSTKEHSWDYWIETWKWKFNKTQEWREPNNGGMYKLSKFGVTPEPDNWVGIGKYVPCDLNAELPQSDCPKIDKCTAAQCLNISGVGQCVYNSMVCNHPNWNLCYPMTICKPPAPTRYNAGCNLSSAVFGHTTSDILAFGMYGTVPEQMWYNIGCTRQPIDCEVSKWSQWNYCPKCDNTYNQSRARHIKKNATTDPAGKCVPLSQSRSCGMKDQPDLICGRIFFNFVNWQKEWAEFINPSTQPLEVSDWVMKQGCEPVKSGNNWVDFKKNTTLMPGQKIRLDFKNITIHTGKNNILCLLEVDNDGDFTGSHIHFDQAEFAKAWN